MESQAQIKSKKPRITSVGRASQKLPRWAQLKFCARCCEPIELHPRSATARHCWACNIVRTRAKAAFNREHRPLIYKAHQIVAREVEGGRLPALGFGSGITCVDCGKYAAQCYDHRDYTKPLEVDPVCGGCNVRRGPGYPYNKP
jgi:hypothetical protein